MSEGALDADRSKTRILLFECIISMRQLAFTEEVVETAGRVFSRNLIRDSHDQNK
jgi:hypothetical protein